MRNITIFHLKIIVFAAVKNCSILHGRVFVMRRSMEVPSSTYWLAVQRNLVDELPYNIPGLKIRNQSHFPHHNPQNEHGRKITKELQSLL